MFKDGSEGRGLIAGLLAAGCSWRPRDKDPGLSLKFGADGLEYKGSRPAAGGVEGPATGKGTLVGVSSYSWYREIGEVARLAGEAANGSSSSKSAESGEGTRSCSGERGVSV